MTRVRCYYRYSSDEQSDGWSIEAQDKACRSFIASHPDWVAEVEVARPSPRDVDVPDDLDQL